MNGSDCRGRRGNLAASFFSSVVAMRVISLNVNGIRSAEKKGLSRWLDSFHWDVLCVQELKAHHGDIPLTMQAPCGASAHYHCATKKGYSGVGLYAKRAPDSIRTGFGNPEFDAEGRYVQADFGKLSIISLYQPSGSSGPERQAAKFRFLEAFLPHLQKLRRA